MTIQTNLLLFTVLFVLLPSGARAFGAGDIPDFSYLEDRAFRHGDIENIISTLVKTAGGAAAMHSGGGGLLGFAKSVIDTASGGAKFDKMDVKRVYFGNWLRDYSQAMDIAGLSKLSADTLVMIVSILGFMAFGYATEEFEVTADRLGVYLPVEHIDNPKGYAENEGDARKFHPKLRPPVDRRELEIDQRTGMKNYMATEDGGWDTSTAFIRRTLRACIEKGRYAHGRPGAELWEAYRLLGTGNHTIQDLLAHSNWCEIALTKMGHRDVFCHVGDNVFVNTPNGRAPPLVTGTFGSADFMHSMLGEATDHISQASVTDLSEKMQNAQNSGDSNINNLKNLLGKLPIGGGGDKLNKPEQIQQQAQGYNFNPDDVMPREVQQQLWELLKWRDSIFRDVMETIEKIPGLSDLVDELTNALNAYVYTVLAPYLTPILQQVTQVLGEGSKTVIDSEDQYEVFNNPNASDPSHSLLSKDHFGLILNEPAGKIAQRVNIHTVTLVVQAWSDNSNPDQVINQILEAFHHPFYATGRSQIQHEMMQELEKWFGGLGSDMEGQVLQALRKESVRNGQNKRIGSEDNNQVEPGYSHAQNFGGGGGQRQQGGYSSQSASSGYGSGRTQGSHEESYGRNQQSYDSSGRDDNRHQTGHGSSRNDEYGSGRSGHGESRHESSGYGGSRTDENNSGRSGHEASYGRSSESYGGRESGYGESRNESSYGRGNDSGERHHEHNSQSGHHGHHSHHGEDESRNESSYGRSDNYASSQPSYSGNESSGYGAGYEPSYGGRGDNTSSGRGDYGRGNESYNQSGYGESNRDNYGQGGDSIASRGDNYGESRNESSYGRGDYSSNAYGSGNNSYGQSGGYGGQEERSGYGGGGYGNDRSGYGGNEETFGAERLNIQDERHEGHGGHRGHRGHTERQEYESNY